jgi:hypothetical protein
MERWTGIPPLGITLHFAIQHLHNCLQARKATHVRYIYQIPTHKSSRMMRVGVDKIRPMVIYFKYHPTNHPATASTHLAHLAIIGPGRQYRRSHPLRVLMLPL